MFSATHFTYDGVYSGIYGLRIASFDSDNVENSSVYSPEITTSKAPAAKTFFCAGATVKTAPTFSFTVLCEGFINTEDRREIMKWLRGDGHFKKLQFHQADLEPYFYMGVFSEIEPVYFRNNNVGFNLTVTLNSEYARAEDIVVKTTLAAGETKEIILNNESDTNGYIYPTVDYKNSGETSGTLTVKNASDNERVTKLTGVESGESIELNGELRMFTTSTAKAGRFSIFNGNWLRLKQGKNSLSVTGEGDLTIRFPVYVFIGF